MEKREEAFASREPKLEGQVARDLYFDATATSPMEADAIAYYADALSKYSYNPAAVYRGAQEVAKARDEALASLAALLDCEPDEIIVTSGATEASNQVFKTLAWEPFTLFRKSQQGADPKTSRTYLYLISQGEHPATRENLPFIEQISYPDGTVNEGVALPLKALRLDLDYLEGFLQDLGKTSSERRRQVRLLSCILVSNETGAIQPYAEITRLLRTYAPQARLHYDGVQALGKIPLSFRKLGCDYLTLSGHKCGAPKGIGFLLMRKNVQGDQPLMLGGGQQRGLRSGTENVPLLMTAVYCIRKRVENQVQNDEKAQILRGSLLQGLAARKVPFTELTPESSVQTASPSQTHVPHILAVRFPFIRANPLVNALSARGIYISAGSACSAKESAKASQNYRNMGLSKEAALQVCRISFGPTTTAEEVQALVDAIATVKEELQI